MHGKHMITTTFTAQLETLDAMLEWIRHTLLTLGVAEEFLNNIEIACEEALINIIQYSYPEEIGHVSLSCSRGGQTGKSLIITFLDQGVQHNPLHSVSLPLPPRIGGYGIYLILRLMDDVIYRYVDGNNELTLIKHEV